LASLILVVNVVNVGKLQRKRTLAASRGFLAAARLSCWLSDRLYCPASIQRYWRRGYYKPTTASMNNRQFSDPI